MQEVPNENEKQELLETSPDQPGTDEEPDTEKAINAIVGVCEQSGLESLRQSLKKTEPERVQKLTQVLTQYLNKKPGSLSDKFNWLTCAAVLSFMDPKTHATLRDTIIQTTQDTLQGLDADMTKLKKKGGNPFYLFNTGLEGLYMLIQTATVPECKQLCVEVFSKWESSMSRDHRDNIYTFLQEQIDVDKKAETDDHVFMKDAFKETMDTAAKEGKMLKLRSVITEKNGEFFYTTRNADGKTRTWSVEMYAPILLCFRSTDEKESGLMFSVDFLEGLSAIDDNSDKLAAASDVAVKNYAKEHGKEQQQTLNAYDFPKDRNIVHIRLFPQDHDKTIAKSLSTSSFLSSIMKDKYGEVFTARPPLFSDDPAETLARELQDVVDANNGKPVHFCIDIFSHGSKNHFDFARPLEAKHTIELAKKFPKCTFTYNTVACFGGGMTENILENEDFKKNGDLQSRVTIFTQSKSDIPNIGSRAKVASVYYAYFMQALQNGKSYGEAHRIADLEVKKYLPVDAEAIINGKLLVMDKDFGSTTATAA